MLTVKLMELVELGLVTSSDFELYDNPKRYVLVNTITISVDKNSHTLVRDGDPPYIIFFPAETVTLWEDDYNRLF